MKKIIFFSNNKNKILEVTNLFLDTPYQISNLNEYKNMASPKETGKNFKENAKIKSIYGTKKFKKICFADDSGICIDVFGGLPGINSKEFLNSTKNKKQIFNKIINETKNQKNFDAFFITTICLSLNTNNYGLVNIDIGSGTVVSGTFSSIDWSLGPYFIETGLDVTGGITYSMMTTNELMSVPYALYAKTSGGGPPGPAGATGPAGAAGATGQDGATSILQQTTLLVGNVNCPNGGLLIENGIPASAIISNF